jgi:hypothetical protein
VTSIPPAGDRTPGVIFARPTYGSSPDRAIDNSHLAAIMYAANHGVIWAGPACPDRTGWNIARNGVAEEALGRADTHGDVSGVLWVDDDVLVPVDAFYRLIRADLALVGALYFQRAAPYLPVAGSRNAKGDIDFWWDYPADSLIPLDAGRGGGFGFGCCYTSIEVLEEVAESPEAIAAGGPFSGTHTHAPFGEKRYGEDFLFCLRALDLGAAIPHVDTGIRCSHHLGSRYADETLFKLFRGEILPEPGGEAGGFKRVEEGAGESGRG